MYVTRMLYFKVLPMLLHRKNYENVDNSISSPYFLFFPRIKSINNFIICQKVHPKLGANFLIFLFLFLFRLFYFYLSLMNFMHSEFLNVFYIKLGDMIQGKMVKNNQKNPLPLIEKKL